jgi:hypothetical protein
MRFRPLAARRPPCRSGPFLEGGATQERQEPEPAEVDEGSITAWATFGAAMAEATATLERGDRVELLGVLERLAQATQALVDSLRGDAVSQPPEPAPRVGSPRLGLFGMLSGSMTPRAKLAPEMSC